LTISFPAKGDALMQLTSCPLLFRFCFCKTKSKYGLKKSTVNSDEKIELALQAKMKGSFKLGTIGGIGVFIHWTFSILILFIIFNGYRQGQNTLQLFWMVVFVLSIFITVFLHELGHATAAKRYQIKTKDITLLPIGGVARLERMPEKPGEELIVALAGPAVNVAIAIVCSFFVQFPQSQQEFQELMMAGINEQNFLINFFTVNLWLSAFNLIPAFPMDGGRVLRALLSMRISRVKATLIAARMGQLLAAGFVFAGFYVNPFLIFIGLFVMLGAQAELESVRTGHVLKGYLTGQVTMNRFETLQANQSINDAVRKILSGQCKTFLVMDGNEPFGILTRNDIIRALAEKGSDASISDVLNPGVLRLETTVPIDESYRKMTEMSTDMAVVTENGKMVGVIDIENILEFMMIKSALEKAEKAG
jgi:Zn-dependent protease/predicted transcriptional regulator